MQLPSFIFNANTMTPEQLARNRALAEAMLNRGQTGVASNVGEGLAQLGQALGGRLRLSGIDKAMRAGQERAYSGMANAYGGAPAAAPVAASVVSGGAGGGGGGGVPKGKQGFVDMLGPAAIQYGNQIGVDPRIILAQAAQETGWGRSAPGNNYFGIKSHGKSGGQTFTTHEVINGKRVKMQDSFRSFNSPADSVAGYADFLTSNKRYRPMLGAKGLEEQVAALGRSGYATDPNYANSIYNIAKGINLDGVQPASAPMGSGMTGFPPAQAPAPAQIAAAPSQAPQIVPTAGPAPQAPQMAPQAPLSAYQRMMATSLGKEAGGLAAPPNRAQMASVMGNAGPARSPFAPQSANLPISAIPPQNGSSTADMPVAPQQSRSAGLRSFIGSSDFAHLEPAQQQMVIADYNRALEAENPAPVKPIEVGGRLVDPTTGRVVYEPPPGPAEPPKTRTVRRGNQEVTQEWDATTGTYKDVATGDAFKTTPDTNITNNVGGGGVKEEKIFDRMTAGQDAANAARSGLSALTQAEAALPGAITGAAANERLALQKIASLFGVGDTQAIENTETFRSAIAPQVAAMLKATVGTAQISNADREFAEKAAGGAITLDANSIGRLLNIMRAANSEVVRSYKARLDGVYPDTEDNARVRALLDVPQAPKFYSSPIGPQAGAPTPSPAPQTSTPTPRPPDWQIQSIIAAGHAKTPEEAIKWLEQENAKGGWTTLPNGVRVREKVQ